MIEPGALVFVGAAGFVALNLLQFLVNLFAVVRKADKRMTEDELESLLAPPLRGEPAGLGPGATQVFAAITLFFLLLAAAGGIWWVWAAWR